MTALQVRSCACGYFGIILYSLRRKHRTHEERIWIMRDLAGRLIARAEDLERSSDG